MSGVEVHPRPRDNVLIDLLVAREGQLTTVHLTSGRRVRTFNILWWYELGAGYSRVTTNSNPTVEGESSDVFDTRDVTVVLDSDDMVLLDLRDGFPFPITLRRDELTLAISALDEILTGPAAIEEWEFVTRTGGTRQQARELLRRLTELSSRSETASPRDGGSRTAIE